MDAVAALLAVLTPALPDWQVQIPSPLGIVAADTPPEQFPPSVIVELAPGGGDAPANPTRVAVYRLRFMAPSGIAALAGWEQARAVGRDPATGMRRGGRSIAGQGYLRSLFVGPAIGPSYDPDTGTPTYFATATAVWYDVG